MIPYGRQQISEEDIEAVVSVLRSDFLTQGPAIERFERAVAERCEVPYAVAVSNATAALHLAYLALGMSPGKIGWTSPNTFVASANAFLYCGGTVDFVDIDPGTWNLQPAALARKYRLPAKTWPTIVTPVHFAGQPCEMAEIADLARFHGAAIVEDASHAIGATYDEKPVGACAYSDITVFSFHPVKIITTGEGGMLLTRNKSLYEKLVRLRSHGITRNPAEMSTPSHGEWYYEQLELGMNYRMTDIQAALGLSQLQRLDAFIAARRDQVKRYSTLLRGATYRTQTQAANQTSAHHLYPIQIEPTIREKVYATLRKAGIGVNVHYIPVPMQNYYRSLGLTMDDLPVAKSYYRGALSLPLHPSLSDEQQTYVANTLQEALKNLSA